MSGMVGMVLIGVGAWYVLTYQFDYSSMTVNTSHRNDAVRLDPGMDVRGGDH
ncbi:hypothetical protein [Roseibium sp.]|uniref:hypothetical protein n=1 Tax=Roseibium sp. TaxID=1936156 RepID=UPI003A97E4A8